MLELFGAMLMSLITITLGIILYKNKNKISYILIYLAVALFYTAVLRFMNKQLELGVGMPLGIIADFAVSIVSSYYLTQSCKKSLKVGNVSAAINKPEDSSDLQYL